MTRTLKRIVVSAADCQRIYGPPPHVLVRPVDLRGVSCQTWITSAHMEGELAEECEFRGDWEKVHFVRRVRCPWPLGYALWVAESFVRPTPEHPDIIYAHDTARRFGYSWRSAVQMRRDESRTTLTVLSVSVTREAPWCWVLGVVRGRPVADAARMAP